MSSPNETPAGPRAAVDVVAPFVGTDAELEALAARLNALRVLPGDTLTIADNRPGAAAAEWWLGATAVRFAAGRPTSYYARNRGVEYGHNDWLVFLDADVEPSEDLIERYFESPVADEVAILGGGIFDDEPGPSAAEQYSFHRKALGHSNTTTRPQFAFAQTANAAVRRSAFEAVGGFNEELRSGGDADLCFRIRAAGYTLDTRFDAKVTHHNRTSVRSFFRQYARYGSGSAWLETQYPGFSPKPNPLRVLRGILSATLKALFSLLRGDRVDAQVRAMDVVENTASFVGRFASNQVPAPDELAQSGVPGATQASGGTSP